MTRIPVNSAELQRRLFALTRGARRPLIVAAAASTLAAGVVVAQMLVASRVIASVFPARDAGADLPALLGWLAVLLAARALLAAAHEHASQRLATRVKSSLRSSLAARLVAVGPARLRRERTGELVTTLMDGVEKLDAYFRRFVPQVIATAVVPLVVLAAVAWLDPASAGILALTGPLILVFMWLLGAAAEQRTRRQWETLGRLGGRFLDTLQGLPTLTMFGRERAAVAGLAAASEEFRARTMGVLRIAFLSGLVLELAASVSTALVAASIGVRLIEGWMPFETGLAVLLLAPEFYLPFRQLGQRHHAGMEGVAAAERLFALGADLDPPHAPLLTLATSRPDATTPPTFATGALRFDGVSFTYPGAGRPALAGVDLDLAPGTLTALVGPSGAGKSTLAALVLRFLEPSSGRLLFEGRPIAEMAAADWRRFVTLVPQRPRFFDGSLLWNLRIGNPAASIDEVVAAADAAGAHAFIAALPRGYETPVGEAAARLSGGEQQRLAVARALLKPAPIVLFDEPTSSLDPASEAHIEQTIAALARQRTVLVIAHRLHTIRRADSIVVVEGGRIVEAGRHAALLEARGTYARLTEAAAREVA